MNLGDADGEVANAADHADAFGDTNCSTRVEHVEQVGAFQRQLIGGDERETLLFLRGGVLISEQTIGLCQ